MVDLMTAFSTFNSKGLLTVIQKVNVFPFPLFQKQKKKKKPEVFNFSAIHLIHDPQGTIIMTSQFPIGMIAA